MDLDKMLLAQNIFILEDKLKKKEALAYIASEVSKRSNIDQKKILHHLIERENISSTGFEKGIAIPHCQIEELDKFHIGLVVAKEGIDFNSIDKQKSYILFYIIGPNNQKEKHIKLLSSASRLLSHSNIIDRLKEASSTKEIEELLLKASLSTSTNLEPTQKMLFQIFVSSDSLFNQFLEIAVSQDIKSISILEGESAASYIYKLPLFASFWDDQSENFYELFCLRWTLIW